MFARIRLLFVRSVQLAFALFLFALSMLGVSTMLGFIRPQVHRVEVPVTVEIPEGEFTFDDALRMADEMGVPRLVAKVLLRHEGAGRFAGDLKRCELQSASWKQYATDAARLLVKAKKIHAFEFEEQRDAMRCSYGPGQVAGWWAPKLGLIWSDLTDLKTNTWATYTVYLKKRDEASKAGSADYWTLQRATFRRYNGGGPDAEAYADARMKELTVAVFEEAKRAGWLG